MSRSGLGETGGIGGDCSGRSGPHRHWLGEDSGTGFHLLAGFDGGGIFGSKDYVHARAKLNIANAFARGKSVADLLVTDDAARDKARDLLADDASGRSFDRESVLFVVGGGSFVTGDQELAGLIGNIQYAAGDRGPVYVNVEDIQEDTDACFDRAERANRNDSSVGGRDDDVSGGRDAIRVAKEVEAKGSQDEEWQADPVVQEVSGCDAEKQASAGVVNTVGNDLQISFSHVVKVEIYVSFAI